MAVQKSRQDERIEAEKRLSIDVRKADLPVIRLVDINHYILALPAILMNEFHDRTNFIADGVYLNNLE